MPDTRWIKQFLIDNLALYRQGRANKIEWVGVNLDKQSVVWIKFLPPESKEEQDG